MLSNDISLLKTAVEQLLPMSDDDLGLLQPHFNERKLKKGEHFATEGKTAIEIGYVLEGNLRHYYTSNGEEKTTYFYFENHFVASYLSVIRHEPSNLTIEALTDCRLLTFRYAAFQAVYDCSHTWERFGRLMAEYLAAGLEERMVGLLMLSPEQRYKALLEGSKQKIIERIPQHYIASYLGVTPVSLSRIRSRLLKN